MRYEIAAGTIFMLRIWHCRENCNFESEEERGWCLISFLTALRQQNRQSCIHKMVAERTSTIQSAWPLLRRFDANIGSFTRTDARRVWKGGSSPCHYRGAADH